MGLLELDSLEPSPIETIGVGSLLDARDGDGSWFVARVCAIAEAWIGATQPNPKDVLCVHFLGWKKEYDLWFYRDDMDSLSPLHTRVPPWRRMLHPGQRIECRAACQGLWYLGWILQVHEDSRCVIVAFPERAVVPFSTLPVQYLGLYSDDLAQVGTHVRGSSYVAALTSLPLPPYIAIPQIQQQLQAVLHDAFVHADKNDASMGMADDAEQEPAATKRKR
jgi:hypothetical protein